MEYEKTYIALIEQVKDKTHDDKVSFLMSHMDELRGMVTLFSYTRDDSRIDDELLANVMIYRYEHNISVLDDSELEITEDYISETESKISHRRAIENFEAEAKFKREHPEEYRQKKEKERQIINRLVNQMILEQPEFEQIMAEFHKEKENT